MAEVIDVAYYFSTNGEGRRPLYDKQWTYIPLNCTLKLLQIGFRLFPAPDCWNLFHVISPREYFQT